MSNQTHLDSLLARTAYWIAAVRAQESAREDRLFDDPWADALAGPGGMEWIAGRAPHALIPIVVRTRFFDDFLQRVTVEDGIRQIVTVAAGFDTRAFRLRWPDGLRFFELDQASVLEHKEHILSEAGAQPRCERFAIVADLAANWEAALDDAGFDARRPAAWLMEGLLFYLPPERLAELLERAMAHAAARSRLGFDVINRSALTSAITREWVEMQAQSGAPWLGTMDNPQKFLEARGWKARAVMMGGREANYGRWPYPVIPAMVPGIPRLWFVIGENE